MGQVCKPKPETEKEIEKQWAEGRGNTTSSVSIENIHEEARLEYKGPAGQQGTRVAMPYLFLTYMQKTLMIYG
jgi:hypothetical protein